MYGSHQAVPKPTRLSTRTASAERQRVTAAFGNICGSSGQWHVCSPRRTGPCGHAKEGPGAHLRRKFTFIVLLLYEYSHFVPFCYSIYRVKATKKYFSLHINRVLINAMGLFWETVKKSKCRGFLLCLPLSLCNLVMPVLTLHVREVAVKLLSR